MAVAQQLALDALLRVAERDAHQEPVHLRLGQRIGAVVLGRVLRRDHHERRGSVVGRVVDRDLALGHRLEQRGLRARRRAVDLVGEHDVREDRPALELEHLAAAVVDRDADDVARQQVAGELDAAKRAAERRREGARERRLADAGDVLDEQVAARQQRDHRGADRLRLAADDFRDGILEPSDGTDIGRGERRRRRRGGHLPPV